MLQRRASRGVELLDLLWGHLLRQLHGRESSLPQDLVGIGVTDTAEHLRIGESTLQRVIRGLQHGGKLMEVGVEYLQTSRIQGPRLVLSGDHIERRTLFRACLLPH